MRNIVRNIWNSKKYIFRYSIIFFYFKRYIDVNMNTSKSSLNSHGIVLSCIVLWDCIRKTSLSDCSCTRTQNHLFRKRTLNHLESSCSHLNFIFCACFEQGVSWHSGNYRVRIHSETRTWHDKNIQLKPVWFVLLLLWLISSSWYCCQFDKKEIYLTKSVFSKRL